MTTPLADHPFVTDGGMETDLIFHHDVDLPEFAAYPLVDQPEGRRLLTDYFDAYAGIARRAGAGLLLESPTWRANPDWAGRLGHTPAELRRFNHLAIELMHGIRDRHHDLDRVLVSGMVGPRGDGYRPGAPVTTEEAEAYHRPQISALAEAGVDLVGAYTLIDVGEAVGVVRAARACGVPVAISFTLETDGRLPDGSALGDAIASVDAQAAPDHFLLNCAHPTHLARALVDAGPWRERIVGVRGNASTKSHAELDEATELDDGDPAQFATDTEVLTALLPSLTVRGGCCGTDARHVAALWGVAG